MTPFEGQDLVSLESVSAGFNVKGDFKERVV